MNQQWNVRKCSLGELRCLTDEWLIEPMTLKIFLNDIYMVAEESRDNVSRNIGFPLHRPGNEKVVGYELVNYGFVDRLLNDENQNGYWIVQPDLPPICIEKLMFFQDAINLMSFSAMKNINFRNTALVSVGDEPTDRDFEELVNHFSRAKVVACFENSLKGNILDVRVALAVARKTGKFSTDGSTVEANVDGEGYRIPVSGFRLATVRKLFSLKYTSSVATKPIDSLNFSEQLIKRTIKSTNTPHL